MFVQERPCWQCCLKNCPKGTFLWETFYEGSLATALISASSKTTPPVKQKQQLSQCSPSNQGKQISNSLLFQCQTCQYSPFTAPLKGAINHLHLWLSKAYRNTGKGTRVSSKECKEKCFYLKTPWDEWIWAIYFYIWAFIFSPSILQSPRTWHSQTSEWSWHSVANILFTRDIYNSICRHCKC